MCDGGSSKQAKQATMHSTTAAAPVATVALAAPVATVALALRSVPSLARCIMRIKAVRRETNEDYEASVFREVQQALRMLHGARDDDDDDGARRWSRSLFAVCARRARSNEALTFDDVLSRVLRATHRLSREAVELVEEAAGRPLPPLQRQYRGFLRDRLGGGGGFSYLTDMCACEYLTVVDELALGAHHRRVSARFSTSWVLELDYPRGRRKGACSVRACLDAHMRPQLVASEGVASEGHEAGAPLRQQTIHFWRVAPIVFVRIRRPEPGHPPFELDLERSRTLDLQAYCVCPLGEHVEHVLRAAVDPTQHTVVRWHDRRGEPASHHHHCRYGADGGAAVGGTATGEFRAASFLVYSMMRRRSPRSR
jgi:hypothetical protein